MNPKKDLINREIYEAEKEMLFEKNKTELKKANFINEIKHGLGDEIKKNPNRPIIVKKNWWARLKLRLKKIFTTF